MYDKEFLAGHGDVAPEPKQELDSLQNNLWEENHKVIMDCIHAFMQSNAQIPTIAYLARQTGLSRPTIYKHLEGFTSTADFKDHLCMFKLMSTNILRQLYSQSMYGEVRAAKLYMVLLGVIRKNELADDSFLAGKQETPKSTVKITKSNFFENLDPALSATLDEILRDRMEVLKNAEKAQQAC